MRWLLDAMLPSRAADELCRMGHDAVSVLQIGMGSAEDAEIFDQAAESRVIVTENFADYAKLLEDRQARAEACTPVVFVRREALPRRGAMAMHLARTLDRWAQTNPEPFIGLYWL